MVVSATSSDNAVRGMTIPERLDRVPLLAGPDRVIEAITAVPLHQPPPRQTPRPRTQRRRREVRGHATLTVSKMIHSDAR